MNFWQFRQHVLQVLSSIQKPYVYDCMNTGHATVAISLHGGREQKEKTMVLLALKSIVVSSFAKLKAVKHSLHGTLAHSYLLPPPQR